MEAVQAAIGFDFDMESAAMERLRLPTRMKGGGSKKAVDTKRPALMGALLDVLPRCIDRKAENGEELPRYYLEQLMEALGKRAYDAESHRNDKFVGAENIGPFPEVCKEAWIHIRKEAMENYGLTEGSGQEEWGKLGPLVEPTPTNAKYRGAADRTRLRRGQGRDMGRSEGVDNAHEG
jgi:hypothetical protein